MQTLHLYTFTNPETGACEYQSRTLDRTDSTAEGTAQELGFVLTVTTEYLQCRRASDVRRVVGDQICLP